MYSTMRGPTSPPAPWLEGGSLDASGVYMERGCVAADAGPVAPAVVVLPAVVIVAAVPAGRSSPPDASIGVALGAMVKRLGASAS